MKRAFLGVLLLVGCHTWTEVPAPGPGSGGAGGEPAAECEAYGCPCFPCEIPNHDGQELCPAGTWVLLECSELPESCVLGGITVDCDGRAVVPTCCPLPEEQP